MHSCYLRMSCEEALGPETLPIAQGEEGTTREQGQQPVTNGPLPRAYILHLTPLLYSHRPLAYRLFISPPYPARSWEPPLNHSFAQYCMRVGVVTWITHGLEEEKKKEKILSLKVRFLWEPASGSLKEHIIGAFWTPSPKIHRPNFK